MMQDAGLVKPKRNERCARQTFRPPSWANAQFGNLSPPPHANGLAATSLLAFRPDPVVGSPGETQKKTVAVGTKDFEVCRGCPWLISYFPEG